MVETDRLKIAQSKIPPNVRVYGKAVVLTGFIDVKAIYKNEEIVMMTRFLEVQRKVDGNWLLAAWQAVRYVTE